MCQKCRHRCPSSSFVVVAVVPPLFGAAIASDTVRTHGRPPARRVYYDRPPAHRQSANCHRWWLWKTAAVAVVVAANKCCCCCCCCCCHRKCPIQCLGHQCAKCQANKWRQRNLLWWRLNSLLSSLLLLLCHCVQLGCWWLSLVRPPCVSLRIWH